MAARRPTVYTIPSGVPFADALAAGILENAGGDPLAAARTTVLLPTRRACRTLREAFLRRTEGAATLFPRLQPIGEVDPDELLLGGEEIGLGDDMAVPPAVPELRRRLLLARMILARRDLAEVGAHLSADQAAWLAAELAGLLDQIQTERLSFDGLEGLVPEEYAAHWARTLAFLKIVSEHWPGILKAEGAIDPAARRNALLEAQARAWRAAPPAYPVIAAGSTGSIPATADLLVAVAGLPEGCVVLPGLDRHLEPEAWSALADPEAGDPTHPQFGLARLLEHLGVTRDEVADWPAPALRGGRRGAAARARLVCEAMRPAGTTDRWRAAPLNEAEIAAATRDVAYVECPGPREEAGVIALALREALEGEGHTAALVTPDRELARRVAVELKRWGIEADDSAGTPLAATPPGAFLRLTAGMVAADFAPVPLLAALKHPLAAGGRPPGEFRRQVRVLERTVLRGPRPAPGIDGLARALRPVRRGAAGGEVAELAALLDDLGRRLDPLSALIRRGPCALPELIRAHVRAAEALAATDAAPGGARLWAGEAGEAAALFIDDVAQAAAGFPPVDPAAYPELLNALMSGRAVRPRYGRHPRLQILGLLEARLQHADTVVLGGLNEGSWPPEPPADPWMSRPMRAAFGLPLPERRIGLTAHDFAQAFCASRVVLTRSLRTEGAPAVPSRWLLRLGALLDGADVGGRDAARRFAWPTDEALGWFAALNAPDEVAGMQRPAPRPPLSARPRRLSVTRIERWMRDPYALYAETILNLRRLDPIDADPGAAEHGQYVHAALEVFIASCEPGDLPPDALDRLLACGREAFADALARPAVAAFWWPRFERIAAWFIERERARRPRLAETLAETAGQLSISAPGGPFTVTALADRVDRLEDGSAAILDYKTGVLPAKAEVDAGLAPQLPLEAAIALAGGFAGLGRVESVTELAYWHLKGGRQPGDVRDAGGKAPDDLAAATLAGLERLIERFDDPATPYPAQPRPAAALRYNDYAHLARIKEWSAARREGAP